MSTQRRRRRRRLGDALRRSSSPVQRATSPARCSTGAPAHVRRAGRRPTTDVTVVVRCPARSSCPLVAQHLAQSRHRRRRRLPRRGDPGRHPALRLRRRRGRARAPGGRAGHRRARSCSACSPPNTHAAGASTGSAGREGHKGEEAAADRARDGRIAALPDSATRLAPTRNASAHVAHSSCPRARSNEPRSSSSRTRTSRSPAAPTSTTAARSTTRASSTSRCCGPRRSRATSRRGCSTSAITGRDWVEETGADVVTLTELHYSKATARPIRMVLAVAGRLGRSSRSKDLPAGVRVQTEYPELTRRFFEQAGVDARDHPLVRRDRGEDPRDRRRGRRDHRDRPRAARRGAEDHRHDPRVVHRAHRQPATRTPTPRSARRWSSSRRCSPARSRRGVGCS